MSASPLTHYPLPTAQPSLSLKVATMVLLWLLLLPQPSSSLSRAQFDCCFSSLLSLLRPLPFVTPPPPVYRCLCLSSRFRLSSHHRLSLSLRRCLPSSALVDCCFTQSLILRRQRSLLLVIVTITSLAQYWCAHRHSSHIASSAPQRWLIVVCPAQSLL